VTEEREASFTFLRMGERKAQGTASR